MGALGVGDVLRGLWVPALMLVLTSAAVLLVIRLARRHADMVKERERLLAHGHRVPADVV
jgi:hypothetical protein